MPSTGIAVRRACPAHGRFNSLPIGAIVSIALPTHDAGAAASKRHHLLIAGTGRAGTSFLVRFLTELGLDTHISRFGNKPWYGAAQAGLEDMPVAAGLENLPYIFKTPWAYQFVEEVLADPRIELDGVIIPMRDLMEAAASRSIIELQAIHSQAPWMARLARSWKDWSITAGGAVFSLEPVDQSRLLAVGFHRLVNRLVQAEVPLIFVAFPRMVEDAGYLFSKLRPVLPASVSLEQAQRSHRRIANASLARVGRELRESGEGQPLTAGSAAPVTLEALDNIALRRELVRLRDRLAESEAALARSQPLRRLRNRGLRALRTKLSGSVTPKSDATGSAAAIGAPRPQSVD
jgi:hypothetical protein